MQCKLKVNWLTFGQGWISSIVNKWEFGDIFFLKLLNPKCNSNWQKEIHGNKSKNCSQSAANRQERLF